MFRYLNCLVVSLVLASAFAFAEEYTSVSDPGPYEVRLERSYFVPMRDGARLSTDLYIPEGLDRPLGTVLERTPYNKNSDNTGIVSRARFFASHGFVYAAQDKRGKYESEGEYLTTANDIEDGDDTIDWIAKQQWSNGKVGQMGCSYPGFTTMMSAQTLNPHLAAIIPQSAAMATGSMADRYSLLWRRGGTVALSMAAWHATAGSKVYFRPPPGLTRGEFLEIIDDFDPIPKNYNMDSFAQDPTLVKTFQEAYLTLPVRDILKDFDAPPNDFVLLNEKPHYDTFFDELGYLSDDARVDVPALHINSWHDYGVAETFIHFNFFRENALSEEARENQYVIIGPTQHCATETVSEQTVVGELDVGDARFDFYGTYLRWYDRWLNGNQDALDGMPHVQYYNIGANEWRSAEEWPLPGTEYTAFYLDSDGSANSRWGNGRLERDTDHSGSDSDSYVHDPATPFTTYRATTGQDTDVWFGGSRDRREIETRNDVLIFDTEPLEEAMDVTGPVKAIIYLSSSAVDTDLDLTLVDVFPDGRAMGVYQGTLRVRYREGLDREVLMEPGKVYPVEVDMNAISNTFLPGHRIRLEVASARYPNHDRNLGTGGDNFTESEGVVARNIVYHSEHYPSQLILPIVAREGD
ncbi:cocaine esterase [Luminiphilus syltensis NOR5-1B]|uniref:Cocaine esterase n=1 Tax=Luminiphilus syltensis NOR5-1B TaxID=565045 RepID=B8KY22_9GAMM|nr:CocE/NonD family hydrolase [Luminiphilus syltensis]EED36755.1 cocaine esterase [Luminiphilus syltensis NOR5-1B]